MSQKTGSLSQPIYDSRNTPLVPRPSPKRNRAPTASNNEAPTLPPIRRKKAPPLKATNSFLFAGAHPLYSREVIEDRHDLMTIRCTQPGCKHPPKVIKRALTGTNNYKVHYQKEHPGIPLSDKEVKDQSAARIQAPLRFFEKSTSDQDHDQKYRSLLLEFITKNNLSFALVDQPETKALFTFLSPTTKQISRRTLMKELKARYQTGEVQLKAKLQDHIDTGGRISLTTDGWAGNNKLDYIAVTGHWQTKSGEHNSVLMDIIELTNPVHDGRYLCEKLLEVTNRLGITCAVMSVTRDNASPNDTMLEEFEAVVASQWEHMEEEDQLSFCCKFNRKEGDVRCCAHIYNIAVQAALKAIKSNPNEHRHHYQHEANRAILPDDERSAFYKIRSLAIIFKLRKLPRAQLKRMCTTLNIKFIDIMCDMPVRWNSTDNLLKAALRMEKPIRAVLMNQEWDQSVRRNLTPSEEDWNILKEMAVFFDIFRRPTVQSQAENYPTLRNTIPNYLHMIRQLNVWQAAVEKPTLKIAAGAAYVVLTEYFKKSMNTRHSFVSTICDPRYKLAVLAFLFDAEGGANSPNYKKGKAHFQHVYSQYSQRARGIAEYKRAQAERAAIDTQGSPSPSPEVEGQEDWRVNPFHGFAEHMAQQQSALPNIMNTEIDRWFREPCIHLDSTLEEQRAYMQSKAYDFPIISQIARDYAAIPATSAPSERVFSVAGNLVSKKRTKISSENVRYVLCLRSWGILVEADEEEEIIIDDNGQIVEQQ